MRAVLWVALVLDQLFLLLIGSVQLSRYSISDFALKEQIIDLPASLAKQRKSLHQHLAAVRLLQQIELTVAGTLLVILWAGLFGPILGFLYSLVSFFILKILARPEFVRSRAHLLFEQSIDIILTVIVRGELVFRVLGVPSIVDTARPSSYNELLDQISKLPSSVLSSTQRSRLLAVIESEGRVVNDIMTPKAQVVAVSPTATLGPVVLSDLQKSGHGYFPVVAKKSEPEGVLAISDAADVHLAKTHKVVRDIMSMQLIWVEEETSLQELVQAFLQEKQYLMFVRNINGDFTGIVTIADLLKQLVGVVQD